MTKYGMLIETDVCIGCDVCLKACKDEFEGNDYLPYSAAQPTSSYGYGTNSTFGWPDTPSKLTPWYTNGHLWMNVKELIVGRYPAIKGRYLPTPCMQCDDAPCKKASTGGAITTRSDGILLIDPVKSAGQSQLVASCPYAAIFWNGSQNIPQKCTFCAHLVDQGKTPRCVEACPVSAMTFGDLNDPGSQIAKKVKALNAEQLHPEYGTQPKVYYSGLIKPFLKGTVVDAKGGAGLSGASVRLAASDGRTWTVTSNFYGDFEFTGLVTGQMYSLQISMSGRMTKKVMVFLNEAKHIGKLQLFQGGQ